MEVVFIFHFVSTDTVKKNPNAINNILKEDDIILYLNNSKVRMSL